MSNELAVRNNNGDLEITPNYQLTGGTPYRLPDLETYDMMARMADGFHKAGFFGVASPAAALVILMAGSELGLQPVQAMRGMHIIKGRISMSADMMVAVVVSKKAVCKYFSYVNSDKTQATYTTWRVGDPEPVTMTYTYEMAVAAKLTQSGPDSNWQKNPTQMLRARCKTDLCHAVYADLIMGIYTPEEIREIDITEHAELTSAGGETTRLSAADRVRAKASKLAKTDAQEVNEPTDAELSNILKALRGACGLSGKAAYADYLRDNYGNNTGTLAGMPREDILLVIEGLKEKAESIAQANRQAPEELPVVEVGNSDDNVQDEQKSNSQACEHPGCGEVLSAFQAERSITKFGTFLCKAHEGQS